MSFFPVSSRDLGDLSKSKIRHGELGADAGKSQPSKGTPLPKDVGNVGNMIASVPSNGGGQVSTAITGKNKGGLPA